MDWWQQNSPQQYAMFIGWLIIWWLIFKVVIKLLVSWAKRLTRRTNNAYDNMLVTVFDKLAWWFYLVVAIYISSRSLQLPAIVDNALQTVFILVVALQLIVAINRLIDLWLEHYQTVMAEQDDSGSHKLGWLGKLLKLLVWVIGVLLAISNLGYNITSLLAGLGIGGIAMALAVQNILEDIFSSFSIYMDQPFKIGDYIVIGDKMGTVKKIGIKTTRLTSLEGEEIVVSNKELTSAQIQNYKKMQERRASFSVGVTYDTSNEQLALIPEMVKEVIGKVDGCRFDRATWKDFGDFSLNFEIVYYFHNNDYAEYLLAQQAINLGLKQAFERAKIEFAYPTQTILVEK
ncbi:MAG: mechanosensitive ion channel family protein [Candidatus Komeilibacteria bacterium]